MLRVHTHAECFCEDILRLKFRGLEFALFGYAMLSNLLVSFALTAGTNAVVLERSTSGFLELN